MPKYCDTDSRIILSLEISQSAKNYKNCLFSSKKSVTALTGLSNNTTYYVGPIANSSGIQLAATNGGANINITKSVTESGQNLTRTNYVITLIGGQSMVLEKYTAYDTLLGTDTGTNVKAVAVAYTN